MKVLLPLLLFALLAGAVYGAEECCTPQCDGECVVDCDGYWAPFSGCNATKLSDGSYCGGGVETSEFVVTQAQLNNGTACPHEVRYRECGFNTCPSDLSCELPERDVLFVVPTALHATIFDDLAFGRALNKLAWRSMLNIYRDDINQNRDNHTFTDRFGNEDLNNDNRTTRISTKVYYARDNIGGFEYSEFRNYEDNIFELRTQTGMLNIATQFDPGFGTARPNNFYLGSIIDSAVNDLMYADHTRPDAEKVIVLFHYPEYTETIYNSQTACDRAEKLGIKVVVVNIGRGPGVGGAADYTVDDTDSRVRTGKALASEPLGLNWITGVATTTNVGFIQEAVLEDLSGVPGVYITRTPDAADQNGQVSVEQQIGQAVRGSTLGDSCSLFGNGHLTTFDGNSLPLNGYGEYWLIAPCESESGPILETDLATPETTLTAQVRLAPCAYAEHEVSRNGVVSAPSPTGRTCARAFVFKYNTHTIEVNFDYEIGKATIIYNGNVLGRAPVGYAGADDGNCFNPVEDLDLQVTTEQRFLGGVDVTIKLASNVIKVRYEADAIGGSVILPGSPLLFSNRGVSSGLCGTYDKCPANDFQNRDDFIVSTSDKDTSIFYNFVEQWRVDPSASFFTATNSGSNYNFEEWVPTFVSIDRSNSREAEAACAYLPEGDFADWCGTEVDDIGSSISESYRFVYNEECDHFCTTGVFKTSAFNAMYANDESICQYRCEYAHPVDYSERDDSVLHLDEDEFDDVSVTVHSSDLPNAYFLFQSASQFGGTYTFQRNISRPDLCVEPNEDGEYEQGEDITTRTYTVEVSCMDLPDVSIVNPGTIRYGPYGFPVVQLRAIVDGDLPTKPQNPRFSWAVTGHEPRDGEVAVNVEDIAFSGGASPIAEFTPPAAGVFNISLALTDGCAIRRSKLQLTVVQKCCTPDIHMVPLSAVLYDDKDDGFGTNHVATLDGSAFDTNVYTPASDGQCPADERYPLGQNRDGGYLSLNYNWTLNAVSTTYGGSVVANVTEVSEDNFYVYRVIQEGEVLSNTTETIVDEYASGNSSVPDTEAPYNPATDLINHVATREGTFHFIYSVNNYTRVVQNVLNAVEEEAAECNVSISESGRGITYDVYPAAAASTSAYHTDYAECEGFYTFKSEFNVAEFGETCANDATGVSQVSCGRAPVTVFNCPTKTVFDYDARSFDTIDIVSYSFDEEGRPLFYKFNQTAGEDIDFSGCQDLGTGEGSGNACQVNVPGAGSYSVDVWVSNGCKQDYQTVTFTATCDDAINTVLTADASFDEADGSNTITVYVNETTAVVDNSAAAVSFIVSVEYLDDIAYEVQDQIPTPVSVSDVTKESYDVTFNVGGEALVFVQGSDSCTYSNASQTVTYNCQGSFNPVVADSTITVTYDEGDVAFSNADVNVTSIGNTSDFTATVRGWRLWNEDGDVSAFNAADDATFVVPTAGSYVAQYFIFDGCAYASRNVSITAVCNINVDASIVANASASSMELGDSIYLSSVDANDNAATYSWTWVQNPDEGLVGTSIGTSENVTVSADDVISGTYEVQVEICSACGNCDTDSFSFTTECPNDGSSITTNEDFTVTFTNQHFKLAELYANTNNLNGEVEEYTYVWRVTSAPEGSVYRPWQNITETETVMVNAEENELSSSVVTTTNYTIIRTVNNVTYYATIDNTDKNEVDAFPACFHPDVAGAYEIELTIEDSCHVVASDSITVTAACNTAPVISASFESTVDLSSEFATAALIDATGTTDDENDQLIYTWEWVSWPQYNASIPVDEQDTPVTQGDETAVLTFTADFPGDYVVTLTVNDGCSEDSQTFTITADYTQCVSPPNATAGNFATAYDYLGRTTIPICLHGGANPEWSSAVVETYNETGRPSEVSDYPQYTSSSSDHLQQTMLVCDTKYTWELVSFDPTSRYTSSNPCSISANKDLKICGGKGISIPAPASTPDPEATSASPASTAQVSFVVLALVALLQVFQAIF